LSSQDHRYFMDHTYSGTPGLTEVAPPPWNDSLPREFRYPFDVLEIALAEVKTGPLRFVVTKEAYKLDIYGPDVVVILMQEERCKVPVYGRHVRAVIRNLMSVPYIGWRPHRPLTKLEAVLTFEFLRDCYTSARSRFYQANPPAYLGEAVREDPVELRIPLGYHSQTEVPQVAMADRQLDSFFAGEVRSPFRSRKYQQYLSTSKVEAREQLWKVLHELQAEAKWKIDLGDISGGQRTSYDDAFNSYSAKMMNSRICLAPRGTIAETYRAYEGLRAGCLVLTNPLPKDEFLYPDAPLLIVDDWRDLPRLLEQFARNIELLEEFRARSLAWWHDHLRPEVVAVSIARELNRAGETLLSSVR
jgi:hypothetical protein